MDDEKIIDYVRGLTLQGKAVTVAEVAERFIWLHPNAVTAILTRSVKHGILSRRYSKERRKYYYVHREASEEYGKMQESLWRRFSRWLRNLFG